MIGIRKYLLVSSIFLILLAAVLYKTFGHNRFRYDATKWAQKSTAGMNIISEDQISRLGGDILLFDLGSSGSIIEKYGEISVKISPDSILQKENRDRILKHKGPVVLFSDEAFISARIWMLLTQLGFKNILILSGERDIEELKNKFPTDSLQSPEQF